MLKFGFRSATTTPKTLHESSQNLKNLYFKDESDCRITRALTYTLFKKSKKNSLSTSLVIKPVSKS